jgi:hypothetical protein
VRFHQVATVCLQIKLALMQTQILEIEQRNLNKKHPNVSRPQMLAQIVMAKVTFLNNFAPAQWPFPNHSGVV